MNKKQFAQVLIAFGIATLFASLVDIASALIPLHLADPNWVYITSQEIAERCIIPLLGIVFLLSGFYLSNDDQENKLQLNFVKSLGLLSVVLGFILVLTTIFCTMTFSSIENQVTQGIKDKGDNLKKQIAVSYIQQQGIKQLSGKVVVPKQMEKYFKQIDSKVKEDIKTTKKSLLKKNIKTILNLLAFIFAYIYIGITTIISANIRQKQLSFKNKQQ